MQKYNLTFCNIDFYISKMIQPFDDVYFMKKALQEAEFAFDKGEVPVGAIVVFKKSNNCKSA